MRRGTRLGGGAGGGAAEAAVGAVPDAVAERVAEVEGGGRAGGGLVHPDPLGRPPDAAGAAEVEVADAVAAGAGDPERVLGAPLEPARRRHTRRVHLVPVHVPERQAHRVRGPPRGRAARLDLHRVRARAGATGDAGDLSACRGGGTTWERPGRRRRRQLRRRGGEGEMQAGEDGEREQGGAQRPPAAGGHGSSGGSDWRDRTGQVEREEWR